MATAINKITNANVYINGTSHLGKAEEIQLPTVQHIMAEHKALGLIGTPEFFSGIDKMEATIKWASLYADVFALAANPTQAVQLQCRASLENWTASGKTAEQPAVVFLTGVFKNVPLGNFKAHENAEYESQLTVTYVKMEIGGNPVVEIDVVSNIYKVNGEDILANYKANLGI